MCSILVFRAMGSTSRVELAQTTRSRASSHSQPFGQNPSAVLAMSKTKVSLARLFIILSRVLCSCCVHLRGKKQRVPLFLLSTFSFITHNLASWCEIWHQIHLLSLGCIFTFPEYLHCWLVGKVSRCINWFHFPDWASLILTFQTVRPTTYPPPLLESFICNLKCL